MSAAPSASRAAADGSKGGSEDSSLATAGVTPFESAMHTPIPDDAWEYQIRRSLQDAAYKSLAYVPYCACMPTCAKCQAPRFMWRKK